MLQKVVRGGDGMACVALKMQQHLSPSEGLGSVPVMKLWALGVSETRTIGRSPLYMQPPVFSPKSTPSPNKLG